MRARSEILPGQAHNAITARMAHHGIIKSSHELILSLLEEMECSFPNATSVIAWVLCIGSLKPSTIPRKQPVLTSAS